MIVFDKEKPTKFENMINQVIQGDFFDVVKQIPKDSIDMILCDPPYGIGFKSARQTYQEEIENDSFEDWLKILNPMLSEFNRIITSYGCCCCCCGGGGKTPVTALFTVEAIKHFELIQTLVWKKFIGLGWRYRPSYENIVILSKDKNNYAFYDETKSCSNVIDGINQDIPNGKYQHPTQKPVELMEKLILIHSKPNDIIFDGFAGSGATLEAAKKSGRRYIGIELVPRYVEMCERRLSQEYFKF